MEYIQLVTIPQEEKFIGKIANDVKEAKELIELGFEYVTGKYDNNV